MIVLNTRTIVIFYMISTVVFAGDALRFLNSLQEKATTTEQKKAKKSQSSSTVSRSLRKKKLSNASNVDLFLANLANDKKSKQNSAQQIQEENRKRRALQEQQLLFLKNYYGNPQYQAAMNVLNDPVLQREYQQNLDKMQFSFFEYTQKVLSSFHTSQKVSKNNDVKNEKDLTSFLQSLKKESSTTKSKRAIDTSPNPVVSQNTAPVAPPTTAPANSDSAAAFLNSLQGKK